MTVTTFFLWIGVLAVIISLTALASHKAPEGYLRIAAAFAVIGGAGIFIALFGRGWLWF